MVRGRKPLATEIHEQRGTYKVHPERRNPRSPQPDGKTPEPPDDFNDDELWKWLQLCEDLEQLGIMSSDCREILIAYCTAYGGWMKARRAVEKTGIVLLTKKDGETHAKRNPFSVELHKYREEMNKLLPELGLTPSARSKLVSLQEAEESPMATLIERLASNN